MGIKAIQANLSRGREAAGCLQEETAKEEEAEVVLKKVFHKVRSF